MRKKYIYPEDLENEILNSNFIPRLIKPDERLKLYHKYYIPSLNGFVKVQYIENINGVEYYFLKCKNKLSACTSYPLYKENIYEFLFNNGKLDGKDIINSNISYTGAEIKYWFIKNKIDLNSSKYYGYWSYLNPESDSVLMDYKYYKVYYNPNRRQKCQIILDKIKSKS